MILCILGHITIPKCVRAHTQEKKMSMKFNKDRLQQIINGIGSESDVPVLVHAVSAEMNLTEPN